MKVSVETQALSMDKPRAAQPTIKFIDEYCASYKNLFPEVRSFEAFKHLHVGMISANFAEDTTRNCQNCRIRARTVTPSLSHEISLESERIEKAKVRFNECVL